MMKDCKKFIDKVRKTYWIDEKRLRDPKFWFMKASPYHSAVLYLQEEFRRIKNGSEISHLNNAINTVPYLTGLAAELYMKGYLVFKGVEPNDVRKILHDLSYLRNECLKHGDSRFENDDLVFLTDTLGVHIMVYGGIRYPDKIDMPIYVTLFDSDLGVLREIAREI